MNKKLSKWGWSYVTSMLRHMGTAGATWAGTSFATGTPTLSVLKTLPLALLFGALIPTTFTFLQNAPDFSDEDEAGSAGETAGLKQEPKL